MYKIKSKKLEVSGYDYTDSRLSTPRRLLNISDILNSTEAFIYAALKVSKGRRKKIYFSKCSDRTLTTAGWAFITPFSSNPKYTNYGSQDLLIVSTIVSGISTTISFTNLLITRRTLSMPGFSSRRSMLPFITISLLLTMRMLAVVVPVLGASMFMLLMDRH
jgi:heme/copper-type cytochrome/quinol oxidase subunit 1